MWPFSKRQTEVTDKNATHLLNEIKNKHPKILDSVISEMGKKNKHWKIPTFREIKPYEPPKGVIPENRNARIAQDREAINIAFGADYSSMSTTNFSEYGYGGFPGYPYLSQLAQISEYRNATQIYAEEMTRKFIELKYKDNNPNIAKLQQLNAAIERFKVCEVFRKAAIHDGYFGRGQIYIDLKTPQKKISLVRSRRIK